MPESTPRSPAARQPAHTGAPPHNQNGESGQLEELRDLLNAAERVRLNRIEARIARPLIDAPSLATVLPDAIRHRTQQDQQLSGALAPIIDETLIQAVHRSPKRIADALSPIMGPAIRKAVAAALQSMIQSLNSTLDHSLSAKGFRWRWEAMRTGKSFGEVVLLHTLQYRVEHVFLIHRPSGIRLAHAGNGLSMAGREDLVASMFSAVTSAVQRFAKDSLGAGSESGLESFTMEDGLEVWIEQGQHALLAAVIRGIPPPDLRSTLHSTLATIHVEHGQDLQGFRGETLPFEPSTPLLQTCLRQASRTESTLHAPGRTPLSPALIVVLATLVGLLGYWMWQQSVERRQWATFFDRANQEPGLHLTAVNREGAVPIVRGMRDPLSTDPMVFAIQAGMPTDHVRFELEPYLSLAPDLILRRATHRLHPPAEVSLSLEQEQGATMLTAAGVASHEWRAEFLRQGPSVPGVAGIKYGRLQDRDALRLQEIATGLNTQQFEFGLGRADLAPETAPALRTLITTIENADRLAQHLRQRLQIEVIGDASQEGNPSLNRRLEQQRALALYGPLTRADLRATRVTIVGAEDHHRLHPSGQTQVSQLAAPRVYLHVTVIDPSLTTPASTDVDPSVTLQ